MYVNICVCMDYHATVLLYLFVHIYVFAYIYNGILFVYVSQIGYRDHSIISFQKFSSRFHSVLFVSSSYFSFCRLSVFL